MNTESQRTNRADEILIVEDSATQAMMLQNMLEKHGFRVSAADNGRTALEALASRKPILVITDIQMPEMDGYELCRRIKADAALKDIPVILRTSLSAPEDIIHGLECGADNFIVKPDEEEFLLSRVHAILDNREIGDTGRESGGIAVSFAGQRYVISADRRQILTLLLTTYETAVKTNRALIKAHEDLRAAQAQLIEAEKLQSVGRLAAGVAHEVKNPLAIMEMGLEFLACQKNSEESAAMLGDLKLAVKRANDVISSLMELTAPDEMGMRAVSMDVLLDRALYDLHAEVAVSGIEVITDYAADKAECRVDTAKIEQAFRNVLTNAVQAMPSGGTLTLRTYSRTLGPADASFDAGDKSGSRLREGERAVIVEVRDTGPGIAPENLTKVFEPFFSTKPTGKGMGLGLTVAKKFIDLHGGRIAIRNLDDLGAVVTMIFKAL